MKKIILLALCFFCALAQLQAQVPKAQEPVSSFHSIKVKNLSGIETDLSSYRGKVLMIVNTASQCGFTPQLKDLQDLQVKYGPRGFQVLAFPSNDFKQDPGTAKESESYALSTFKVTFPLFDKVSVRGAKKSPLFRYLIENSPGLKTDVLWNFEKFLVDRDGKVIDRYRSPTSPAAPAVVSAIEKALGTSATTATTPPVSN